MQHMKSDKDLYCITLQTLLKKKKVWYVHWLILIELGELKRNVYAWEEATREKMVNTRQCHQLGLPIIQL